MSTSKRSELAAPAVHPQATLKGKVTLKSGCCVGPGSVVDGGEGGIVIEENTVLENCVTLSNTRSTPMFIGRYGWMEDFSSLTNTARVGDFVRIETSAKVKDCQELGTGTTVAAGTCVVNRGVIPSQTVLYGNVGTLARDSTGVMRQARIAAVDLAESSF